MVVANTTKMNARWKSGQNSHLLLECFVVRRSPVDNASEFLCDFVAYLLSILNKVSVNKPSSVIAAWKALYRRSKSPHLSSFYTFTHIHSTGAIIIIIIKGCLLMERHTPFFYALICVRCSSACIHRGH